MWNTERKAILNEVEERIKRRSSLKADWQLFASCTPCTMRETKPEDSMGLLKC